MKQQISGMDGMPGTGIQCRELLMPMSMMGATYRNGETTFSTWSPTAEKAVVRLLPHKGAKRDLPMERRGDSFVLTADAKPGDRYVYLLDDDPLQLPDPVSRYLPEGVHGPTEIVDPSAFQWTDETWRGQEYRDYIIYELHVGTFTPRGTFDGVIEKLDYLRELGITAIELMPLGAFPGKRNWGYDGVSMYAVQESYGGPDGLRRLVDAAHAKGLAVVLDVVYNHLGAEGNYLGKFGPYFTAKHKTPWGDAFNYDDKHCEGTRNYVRENALYWIREYHLDGLRMDAVHSIQDDSNTHIVAEIRDAVQEFAHEAGRRVCLMVESDENNPKYVKPRSAGGFGLEGIWSDDFHHALHAIATGENEGYYQDFGGVEKLVKALNEGFVFQGQEFKFWGKPRGHSSKGMPLESHVICIQNHDQVGNRALGERLTELVPLGMRKIMAALLLLAPETPLIFMGQESDESAPFQFFADFGDQQLRKIVSDGRRSEFSGFSSFENDFPDPHDPATYERSHLSWNLGTDRLQMLEWYRDLIRLRKALYAKGDKTCATRALGEHGIEMQVPAARPKLRLAGTWARDVSSGANQGWKKVLESAEGDYRLQVWASPEVAMPLRESPAAD